MSAILAYGIEQGHLKENVARGVSLPKDRKRTVADPEGSLRALGAALYLAEKHGEAPQAIAALRFSALTGLRKGEIEQLTWGAVDLERRVLRLANTKTGESVRPLGQDAVRLLRQRNALADRPGASAFVFPAERKTTGGYAGLPKAIGRMFSRSDLKPEFQEHLASFSHHSCRHAFASVANMADVSEVTIAALLGHTKGGVTAGYIARVDAHLLMCADKATKRIAELLREGQTAQEKDGMSDGVWEDDFTAVAVEPAPDLCLEPENS